MYRDFDDLIYTMKKRGFIAILLLVGFFSIILCPIILSIIDYMNFLMFVVVIFIAAFFMVEIIKIMVTIINLEMQKRHIDEKEKKIINEELCQVLDYLNDQYLLTEHYIIVLMPKIRLIPYDDIVLIANQTGLKAAGGMRIGITICGFRVTNQIYVVLKSGEKCIFDIEKDSGIVLGTIYRNCVNFKEIVTTKKNNVLIGKTKENKQIVSEKYDIKL